MARRIPRPSLTTIGWLAVLAFLGFRVWPQLEAAMGAGDSVAEAPGFSLTTLEGERLSLESLRGQVVLVNFWATWCPPCRLEMPGFQKVYEENRDRGFTVVGISTDWGSPDVVRAFLIGRGITYPIAMATPGVVKDYGGVPALPMSFLIDREGRMRHQVRGYFAEPMLRQAVARLLEDDGRAPSPAGAAAPETPLSQSP